MLYEIVEPRTIGKACGRLFGQLSEDYPRFLAGNIEAKFVGVRSLRCIQTHVASPQTLGEDAVDGLLLGGERNADHPSVLHPLVQAEGQAPGLREFVASGRRPDTQEMDVGRVYADQALCFVQCDLVWRVGVDATVREELLSDLHDREQSGCGRGRQRDIKRSEPSTVTVLGEMWCAEGMWHSACQIHRRRDEPCGDILHESPLPADACDGFGQVSVVVFGAREKAQCVDGDMSYMARRGSVGKDATARAIEQFSDPLHWNAERNAKPKYAADRGAGDKVEAFSQGFAAAPFECCEDMGGIEAHITAARQGEDVEAHVWSRFSNAPPA